MTSKTLCAVIRAAVIAAAICGLLACAYILPTFGASLVKTNPEYAGGYVPWLVFLWAAAAPCFAILALVWKVSSAVRQERVFTIQTARWIKTAAMTLIGDAGAFFAGNVAFLLFGMSNAAILLLAVLVDVFAVSLAVLAAVLSRYVTKAALLQEEADSTI
ncbi:MAG: DUF2975 domain-containing protein [Clostridiales bacterium]|nr:DUF2975 domain-containing protein [Clostridiales bacterium]